MKRSIFVLAILCTTLACAADAPPVPAKADAPPPPPPPAQVAQPPQIVQQGPIAPVPVVLGYNGVGEVHPTSDVTAEEAAWLSILEVRTVVAALDHSNPDVIGFIHQHRLERHFIGPTGPAFGAGETSKVPLMIAIGTSLASSFAAIVMVVLMWRQLRTAGKRK